MKRALVFNGGGSRGAYEIGAWQALEELGVRFDGIYGTSIGALNAALTAQGDLDRAMRIWDSITISQIMAVEDEEDFAIERMVSRKRDVLPFLVENAKHLRMDITPLEKLVREEIDEAKIRASGKELGVMTFRPMQLQAVPMRLKDMKPGQLGDWVIASASCFPIFPARHIDGQIYIDGGYYDNLPIDMALEDGAEEIVAVELHPDVTHPEYARMPWLTTIKPRHNLGGFLDFNPELLRRSRRMGYYDAMKCWRHFDGFLYTFRRVDPLELGDAARRFMRALTRFDGELARRGTALGTRAGGAPLLAALELETQWQPLSWAGVWLRGLELCASAMGFRVDAIYDAESLLRQIADFCLAQEVKYAFDEAGFREATAAGKRALLAWTLQYLVVNGEFAAGILQRLAESPEITAAALFIQANRA